MKRSRKQVKMKEIKEETKDGRRKEGSRKQCKYGPNEELNGKW